MRMIRILFITNSFKDHTPVYELYDLVKCLDKNRYEVHVCCLWKGGPNRGKFEELGVKVHNFNIRSKINLVVIRRIKKYILDNNINVFQSTLFPSNFYGRIAALQAKVPCIISRYISIAEHKDSLLYRLYVLAESVLDRKSDKIVALSVAVKEYLAQKHRISEDKIKVIHDGIDVDKFNVSVDRSEYLLKLGLNPDILTVCCVARLEPVKGVKYLIEAAKRVVDAGYKVQFLVVGGGSLQESLQQLAEQLGIDNSVFFVGFRSDIPEILNVSDVFVMPSLSEGLCNSILEAMAAGKAVIATRAGGIPDIISSNKVGILVEPENSDAIAAALGRVLSDGKLRRVMGERARRHVRKNFSHREMAMKYQILYERLLEDSGEEHMSSEFGSGPVSKRFRTGN